MRSRKSRATIFMMWAMVPLTVFAGLPRIGCVCANGQHKTFCERHRQGTARGPCTCCDHAKMAAGSKVAREADVCRSQSEESACGGSEFDTGRPCRAVVDRTVVLTVAKVVVELDQPDHATVFIANELMPATGPSIAAIFTRGELLPPPDLVVTLGVMLI